MDKKFIYLLAVVFSLGFTFTSCGDDDDDKPTDYAAQIAGTYTGTLNVDLGDGGENIPNQPIKIERTGDNKAKLVIENFTFPGVGPVGTIDVDNIPTSESNGTVKLGDTSKNVSLANNAMTADVAIKSSSVKDKTLTLTINVTNIKEAESGDPMPGLGTIIVKFTGAK